MTDGACVLSKSSGPLFSRTWRERKFWRESKKKKKKKLTFPAGNLLHRERRERRERRREKREKKRRESDAMARDSEGRHRHRHKHRHRERERGERGGGDGGGEEGDGDGGRSEKRKRRRHEKGRSSSSRRRREEREEEESKRVRVKEQAGHIAKVLQETGRVVGYEDEENPFGDTNLSRAFVWHKKIEKQLNSGVNEGAFSADQVKEKHESRLKEIEQVKKRRQEREREIAERQEELDVLQRDRVLAEAAELEQREEAFHTEQARTRSEIRLREFRSKPVDVFYDILNDVSTSYGALQEPCRMLESLELAELEELKRELQSHADLDVEDKVKSKYWESALTLCSHEVLERRGGGRVQHGVHRSLESDIREILKGKDIGELESLQQDIVGKLELGNTGDEEYWEAVSAKITLHLARAHILDKYRMKLQKLSERTEEEEDEEEAEGERLQPSEEIEFEAPGTSEAKVVRIPEPSAPASRYSPEPEDVESGDEDVDVVDQADDLAAIQALRHRVQKEEQAKLNAAIERGMINRKTLVATKRASKEEENPRERDTKLQNYTSRLLGEGQEGDEKFSNEVQLDRKVQWWHERYQAQKPKYVNRVHTGFEWTRYNRTHYDSDNPPPKVVKGYKFNIFYPDLIDKSKTPSYSIERDESSRDNSTCIVRFHAGPPYEDLAFKIVNREWEYGPKFGFKSSFERGILHLYFNFKRQRYRK